LPSLGVEITIGGMKAQTAVPGLQGAHCASCGYTIERAGRKAEGVVEVSVRAGKGEIEVIYEGDPAFLERIAAIVKTLGYQARIRRGDQPPAAAGEGGAAGNGKNGVN
jgi:copper chaperone CopZ